MLTEQIIFMAPEGTRARLNAAATAEDRKPSAYVRRLVLTRLDEVEAKETPQDNTQNT